MNLQAVKYMGSRAISRTYPQHLETGQSSLLFVVRRKISSSVHFSGIQGHWHPSIAISSEEESECGPWSQSVPRPINFLNSMPEGSFLNGFQCLRPRIYACLEDCASR